MSYRIEVSPNNRAGCQATHCKAENVKIKKGEVRQGVMVMFQEHQSMKYRHWGCVTPQIIHNWAETSGGDMELVDGFDECPDEVQEKVKRALEQGHVDDDDWNGDKECNRFDPAKKNQGMFVKTPKKKAKKAKDDEEGEDHAPSPTKKRGRAKKAADVEDEPAPKKRAKKAVKTEDSEEDEVMPAKKSRKSKNAVEQDVDKDAQPAPAAKKGRKAKKPAPQDDEDNEADQAPRAKKAASTHKSKAATKVVSDGEDEPAPAKTRKIKKAAAPKSDSPVKEEDEASKAKPARKGRAKKAAA